MVCSWLFRCVDSHGWGIWLWLDNFCEPYESVKCNAFITESTFGLPIYNWRPQEEIYNEIHKWYERNRSEGKTSVLMGYALGKMQRILMGLRIPEEQLFAHGAILNVNDQLRNAGFKLPQLQPVPSDKKQFKGALVLAPAGADGTTWIKKFEPYSIGYCSGWIAVRGAKNRRALDQGFSLSDHADWKDLNRAVRETGAEKIFVTHGYTNVFARWLNENGIDAAEVKTLYGSEDPDTSISSEDENFSTTST